MKILIEALGAGSRGGVFVVYPDTTSKKKQPPGIWNVEPALAKIMGWRPIGKVRIPASPGVRDTPVGDLDGVPVATLSQRNIDSIDRAHREGVSLPPIDIEITAKGKIHLIDGHHRLAFARKKRLRSIPVKWHFR